MNEKNLLGVQLKMIQGSEQDIGNFIEELKASDEGYLIKESTVCNQVWTLVVLIGETSLLKAMV